MKKKKARQKKIEFSKTRAFMGDRIRMCRIKKVGMRQQFFSAKSKLVRKIDVLRERQQENEKKQTRIVEISRKDKRKRWIVTSKKMDGRKVK